MSVTYRAAASAVSRENELRGWAKKFDVSAQQIKDAVAVVGDHADAVEMHLKGSRASSDARREEAAPGK